MGSIIPVKVLCCLALIDEGEVDWKVMAIRSTDPRSELNFRDIQDIELLFPKSMDGIREWLRWYKTPDGKPLNRFGFDEQWLSVHEAYKVIVEGHIQWKQLLSFYHNKNRNPSTAAATNTFYYGRDFNRKNEIDNDDDDTKFSNDENIRKLWIPSERILNSSLNTNSTNGKKFNQSFSSL